MYVVVVIENVDVGDADGSGNSRIKVGRKYRQFF